MSWLLHWLWIHLGFNPTPNVWYQAWSGFGSDLGEVTLIGSVVMIYRHNKCKTCPRIGKIKLGETGEKTCHRHSSVSHHSRLLEKHRLKYPDHVIHAKPSSLSSPKPRSRTSPSSPPSSSSVPSE